MCDSLSFLKSIAVSVFLAVILLDRNVPAGDDFVNSVPVLTLPQEELKISCIHTDEWEILEINIPTLLCLI